MPYYNRDSKRDPNIDNHPAGVQDFSLGGRAPVRVSLIWEFPKIRGTLFRGPYNEDHTI